MSDQTMTAPVVRLRNLRRSFEQGGVRIDVLRGIHLDIHPGEIVALLGPSGSGKSTMLQAVGLLEGGFEGKIEIAGTDAAALNGDARTVLRRDHLGFVYQFHHLLPDFNATENVMLPQFVNGAPEASARARASELLTALASGIASTIAPASCRAASSSASPWRARWPTGPRWCWRTNRQATSTRQRPIACSTSSSSSCARKAAPRLSPRTTSDWRSGWTA